MAMLFRTFAFISVRSVKARAGTIIVSRAFLPRPLGGICPGAGTAISMSRSRTSPALGSCGESNEPMKTRLEVRSWST